MFRCEVCGRGSQLGESSYKRVLERREKVYPMRSSVNPARDQFGRYRTDDPGGSGWEIVREVTVCSECAVQDA